MLNSTATFLDANSETIKFVISLARVVEMDNCKSCVKVVVNNKSSSVSSSVDILKDSGVDLCWFYRTLW
jgi:hypothetical protein